jgi:hypothetical protein
MYFRYCQIWKQIPRSSRSSHSRLSTTPIIRVLSFTFLQLFYIWCDIAFCTFCLQVLTIVAFCRLLGKYSLLALDFFVENTVTHIIPIAYEALSKCMCVLLLEYLDSEPMLCFIRHSALGNISRLWNYKGQLARVRGFGA